MTLPANPRVAIVHYSAEPCVGGIERLIARQTVALQQSEYKVRLIVGRGRRPARAELVRLPDLDPNTSGVRRDLREIGDGWPPPEHPLVLQLVAQLTLALEDCQQCWVHNALTVFLHPFLTEALRRLVVAIPSISWVVWCEDISAISAYWRRSAPPPATVLPPLPGVSYVTISHARQRELAAILGIQPSEITVISPPLPYHQWLKPGVEARTLVERLGLLTAEPVVLVPAKLLPHKNLDLAVSVAASLRTNAERPAVIVTGADSPHEPTRSRDLHRTLVTLARRLGVEEFVHFPAEVLGRALSHQAIRDLMLISDVVLLPSTEEGFGMPVIEAAALRLPVICANIPAFRESGGAATRFFELTDSPELVARLVQEVAGQPTNRARRQALASGARFEDAIARLARRGG